MPSTPAFDIEQWLLCLTMATLVAWVWARSRNCYSKPEARCGPGRGRAREVHVSAHVDRYLTSWRDEIDSAVLYRAIAEAEPQQELAEFYRRLAEKGEHHDPYRRDNSHD
jgi:hypothetical protein